MRIYRNTGSVMVTFYHLDQKVGRDPILFATRDDEVAYAVYLEDLQEWIVQLSVPRTDLPKAELRDARKRVPMISEG